VKNAPRNHADPFGRSNALEVLGSLVPLKAVVTLLATALLIVAGYYFSLYAIHGFDPDFLEINKCVEAGGRWDRQLRICQPLPGIYTPPDPNAPQY
jgi:hypothetical protein